MDTQVLSAKVLALQQCLDQRTSGKVSLYSNPAALYNDDDNVAKAQKYQTKTEINLAGAGCRVSKE